MRYAWIDSPDNPYWETLERHGIDGLFFDPRQPRVTKAYLEEIALRNKAVGIYIGHAWPELGTTPESFVTKAVEWATPLRKSNSFPRVQWDLEQHDPEFILAVLKLWRQKFPWPQSTSWTLESFQGGWMDREAFVKPVLACRVRVVPQYFHGDMTPFAQDESMKDLMARGFPADIISGCYDAARLPDRWRGFAFTQGRLP